MGYKQLDATRQRRTRAAVGATAAAVAVLLGIAASDVAWVGLLWPASVAVTFPVVAWRAHGRHPSWRVSQLIAINLLLALPLGFIAGSVVGGEGSFLWPLGAALRWGYGALTAPLLSWGLALSTQPLWCVPTSPTNPGVAT